MNPWTHTSRGRAVDLLNPVPEDIDIEEIARALAYQCRYNGNVKAYYSVAEHSVLMADRLYRSTGAPQLAMGALLHDAAEAFTGDITYPMQVLLFAGTCGQAVRQQYKAAQARFDVLIAAHAGVDVAMLHHPVVRDADLSILLDERAVLLDPGPLPWDVEETHRPLGVHLRGWEPEIAEREWLRTFNRYQGASA
jgi:hypothetical protein